MPNKRIKSNKTTVTDVYRAISRLQEANDAAIDLMQNGNLSAHSNDILGVVYDLLILNHKLRHVQQDLKINKPLLDPRKTDHGSIHGEE